MADSFSQEEFQRLMAPWDAVEREIVDRRFQDNFSREGLENFTEQEAATLRALLDRLIPQSEGVDLVGFMDAFLSHPLGRGDRQPGMPPEEELIKRGLTGLREMASARHGRDFAELSGDEQDTLIREVQEGKAKGGVWDRIPPDTFFERLYSKALHGYFAHPRVWMRIGFMGASYPEGYRWLGRGQVKARRERHIGWEIM